MNPRFPTIETVVNDDGVILAYMLRGDVDISAMRKAISLYNGTVIPTDSERRVIQAGLECWHGCGFYHDRSTRGDGHLKNCEGDDDSWTWNFTSGRTYTIVASANHTIDEVIQRNGDDELCYRNSAQ